MEDYHYNVAEVSVQSPGEAEKVYGECHILSVKKLISEIYIFLTTNCPRKLHYSGIGYFNSDGLLTAIYKIRCDYCAGIRARNPRSILIYAQHLYLLAYHQ